MRRKRRNLTKVRTPKRTEACYPEMNESLDRHGCWTDTTRFKFNWNVGGAELKQFFCLAVLLILSACASHSIEPEKTPQYREISRDPSAETQLTSEPYWWETNDDRIVAALKILTTATADNWINFIPDGILGTLASTLGGKESLLRVMKRANHLIGLVYPGNEKLKLRPAESTPNGPWSIETSPIDNSWAHIFLKGNENGAILTAILIAISELQYGRTNIDAALINISNSYRLW